MVPERFFCASPAVGVRWLRADGELEYVRCGAPNRCGYCAMLTACENALVLRLDAFDGDFPRVGLTTTTRTLGYTWDALREAERSLWRDLRRRYGRSIEYCGFVEWTRSRRPHVHHLVKGLERAPDAFQEEVSALWLRHTRDAWQVDARALRTPLGAIAYSVLHHHKKEQAPPPGTKHVKRMRPSRGYFNRPVGSYRSEARELLRDERLYAELVDVLDAPDGAPSWLIEELIAERVDSARAAATFSKPKLAHVREVREVDPRTGELRYRFAGVLRVLSR